MRGGPHRQGPHLAGLDRGDQACFDQPEAVGGGDLAPALPAQHRRRVVEDDPLHLRLGAVVEEDLDPGPHRRQGAGDFGAEHDLRRPLRRLRLDLLVDRFQ